QLTVEEAELLRSQFVTSKEDKPPKPAKTGAKTGVSERSLRSQIVTLKRGQHRKYFPYAFTEQGVAMLSSVLRSARAVKVNIEIMRTFVRLRQLLAASADLERRLAELEQKCERKFKVVFDAIRELLERPEPDRGREIGFHTIPRLKEDAPVYRCFAPPIEFASQSFSQP
ncbi:MAG: ORF6N domain-containing protein, partial [Pedosphaera parvula]|nr:ORF6N domain-containing protein [Pedosphaera parvula]